MPPNNKTSGAWSRRRFLEISALTGGAMGLSSGIFAPGLAQASPEFPNLLLLVYFSGGWDQLLALDPRPNNQIQYSGTEAYKVGGTGIHPAYDRVSDSGVTSVLSSNPSGVQQAGALTFGPAVPANLMAHSSDLCIIRGMTMDTLTHEVGRRYFITGKFPRGLSPNGSSLTTVVAGQEGNTKDIPNLSVSMESYNDGWPSFASPIRGNTSTDLLSVLQPMGTPMNASTANVLTDFEASNDTCEQHAYDGKGLVNTFRESRIKARSMVLSPAASMFNFNLSSPSPEVAALFSALAISTNNDLKGVKGRAAVAAQALTKGVSQAVAVELANGLDDHYEWDTNQATSLRTSFDTLARLISFLKAQQFGATADSVWKHTTMLVFSEFSRTPLLNGRDGRDHHLASSCLLAGPGIKGNVVVGATSEEGMAARKMNLTTGLSDDANGSPVRPEDVHATVLKSMGLTTTHLSNQSPKPLDAIIK